jgi:DnaJ homolog subfamily C member 2
MVSVTETLPALPAGFTAEKDFKVHGSLSAGSQRRIEPVGPHFLAHARRVSPSVPIQVIEEGSKLTVFR